MAKKRGPYKQYLKKTTDQEHNEAKLAALYARGVQQARRSQEILEVALHEFESSSFFMNPDYKTDAEAFQAFVNSQTGG